MPTYPLIELPRALRAALDSQPFPLAPPPPVALPVLPPAAQLPLAVRLGLGAFGVGSLGLWLGQMPSCALVFMLLAGLGWWGAHRRAAHTDQRALAAHQAALAHYLAYPDRVRAYEQAQAIATTPAAVARYRAGRVAAVLAQARCFQYIPAGEYHPPTGRSEALLAHYFRQNFGTDHIFTKCRVRTADLPNRDGWYYPDLIYSDAAGLRIDIEIDEPYVWATGEPHHYVGQDDARNAFFLRHHWLVLRLSEEQVARYPMRCCQLLAELIFRVTGQHYAPRTYRERLEAHPQWDWAQAKHLAAVQSRKSYQANLVLYDEDGEECP